MVELFFATIPLALLIVRLLPVAVALPFFGARVLPTLPRAAVIVVLAFAMAPVTAGPAPELRTGPLLLTAVDNLTVGIVLALLLGLPFFALDHAARALDASRGALTMDAGDGDEASPLASFVRWTFLAAFVAAGGVRATLRVLVSSVTSFPVTGPIRMDGSLAERAARFSSDTLASAVPLLAAVWLAWAAVEIVHALAARVSAPWSQPAVPLPARTLVPLAAIAATIAVWTGAALDLARSAFAAARAFVG